MQIKMLTKAEVGAEEAKAAGLSKVVEIRVLLDVLDQQSVRALRAVVTGMATPEDRACLTKIENKARQLRSAMKSVNK